MKVVSLRTSVKILIVIILIGLLTASCKSNKTDQQMYGVGTRFSSSPRPPGESDLGTRLLYSLKPGQAFKGYYEVENVRPEKHTYAVIAFLNYKQIPVALANKIDLSHTFTLEANKKRWWSLSTKHLSKGFYDYFMLLVWDPDLHSLKEDFRLATDNSYIASNRANLIVGAASLPKRPIISTPVDRYIQNPQSSNYDGIRINKSKKQINQWLKEKVKPEEIVHYFIHIANNTSKRKSFAVIPLLDFRQIPLKLKGPLDTFVTAKPMEIITFEASFKAPKTKGIHELVVINVYNPFSKIKKEDDALIESSIRVPIVVK